MQSIKCSVVGDGAVGKTCIIIRYTQNTYAGEEHVPTIVDHYASTEIIDGKRVALGKCEHTVWCSANI